MTQAELRKMVDLLIELEDREKELTEKIAALRELAEAWMLKPSIEVGDSEFFVSKASDFRNQADLLATEKFGLGLRMNGIRKLLKHEARRSKALASQGTL